VPLVRDDLPFVLVQVPSVPVAAPEMVAVDDRVPVGRQHADAVADHLEIIADDRYLAASGVQDAVALGFFEDAAGDVDGAAAPTAGVGPDDDTVQVLSADGAVDDAQAVEVAAPPDADLVAADNAAFQSDLSG